MDIKVTPITSNQRKNSNKNLALTAAAGAVAGAASRYVLPTKSELSSMVNKQNVDTFVSSAATSARGAERSILKFGGIGALVALGINALAKMFKKDEPKNQDIEYTKLGALVDAPDYACAMMWYTD